MCEYCRREFDLCTCEVKEWAQDEADYPSMSALQEEERRYEEYREHRRKEYERWQREHYTSTQLEQYDW
jgi:hypothetical protein